MYPLPVYNGNTRSRKMGPPRSFTQGQGNQPSMLFDAMGGTIVLGRGGQAATFTRATVATITDQDLVVRQVLSGEVRFGRFRRVQNVLLTSEDFSSVNWPVAGLFGGTGTIAVKTPNFAAAPDGTLTACRVQANRGAGDTAADFSGMRQTIAVTDGLRSVWAKSNTASTQTFSLVATNGAQVVTVGTSWQRIAAPVAPGAGAGQFDVFNYGPNLTTRSLDVLIWRPMLEATTGQSNVNPSEYISTGVLAAPYQGANVDGVQYFPYLNGNTVASNVVTEARGAAISSAILGGYLPEPAATDLLTARADARDMTTGNWTLGATMTRARTSVGADGVANKATRLTGGAVAATNTILTTITAAASSRTYSVLLKRVTGTGTISICQDGLTFTDITSQLNSSTFTLVQLNASQLNAQLGIKISTNGDAIDADWNQFSAGDLTGAGIINSRIPDTITTRNADAGPTYSTTGWLNAVMGTIVAKFIQPPNDGLTHVMFSLNDGTANNRITFSSNGGTNTVLVVVGGVNKYSATIAAPSAGTTAKISFAYAVNDGISYQNNVAMAIGTAGTTLPTVTTAAIGNELGASQNGAYIISDTYYPARLTNEITKALSV